jgi:hypothetical protein
MGSIAKNLTNQGKRESRRHDLFFRRAGSSGDSFVDSSVDRVRQAACKPGSVQPRNPGDGTTIPLSPALRQGSRGQPGRRGGNAPAARSRRTARRSPLFGLAPGGVCHASTVAGAAVRSYRTLSPLPGVAFARPGGLLSVALSLRLGARLAAYPSPRRPLAGTVFPWSPDFPPAHAARTQAGGRPAT